MDLTEETRKALASAEERHADLKVKLVEVQASEAMAAKEVVRLAGALRALTEETAVEIHVPTNPQPAASQKKTGEEISLRDPLNDMPCPACNDKKLRRRYRTIKGRPVPVIQCLSCNNEMPGG